MKYLIYQDGGVVLWVGDVTHAQRAYGENDIAYGEGSEIVAGGFCKIDPSCDFSGEHNEEVYNYNHVTVSGEAEGIKGISSRDVDAKIIKNALMKTDERVA